MTKPTSQSTCVGTLGPGGPIRQLAVDRALHHTGNIHLPLPLKAELKRKQIQLLWPAAAFFDVFEKSPGPDGGLVSEGGRRRPLTYLLAQREVHRLAIAAHAVQHACLDAAATHGPLTQLAGAPVWRRDKMPLVSTLAC